MSAPEFLSAYDTKAQWTRAVEQARWPMGFCCPRYIYSMVLSDVRPLFQCSAYRQETSLSAGSLFENARLPLTKWFLAIYLISESGKWRCAMSSKLVPEMVVGDGNEPRADLPLAVEGVQRIICRLKHTKVLV